MLYKLSLIPQYPNGTRNEQNGFAARDLIRHFNVTHVPVLFSFSDLYYRDLDELQLVGKF